MPKPLTSITISVVLAVFLFHQLLSRGGTRTVTSRLGWSHQEAYSETRDPHVPKSIAASQNDTLGFEKIFVLNLPERSDKRDHISLAAAFSNLTLEFHAGMKGVDIPTKALPEGHEQRPMGETAIGSWRGHMNIIREIVEKRIESALILEDDMDWDIRIKSQMPDFARGVRQFMNASDSQMTHSPYGDGWDVLWVGKCVEKWQPDRAGDRDIFVIENDETVPLTKTMEWRDGRNMLRQLGLPEHSRIVHRVEDPLCTFGYAVSYEGARKILYSLSVAGLAWNFDNALSWWCTDQERAWKQECIGVTPTLFSQHRIKSNNGVSRNSDNDENTGLDGEAHTKTIRISVKNNIEKLILGETDISNLKDSYPDSMEAKVEDDQPPAEPEKPVEPVE